MPRPTVRQESSNKGKQKFTTKHGLDEYDDELEDLRVLWWDEYDEGDW